MPIVNLTPHELRLTDEHGHLVATVPPSGTVARVRTSAVRVGEFEGVPLFRTEYGAVEGLPEPVPGTIYVVSAMVRSHPQVSGRGDVFSPGKLLRDEQGRVIGAIGLTR